MFLQSGADAYPGGPCLGSALLLSITTSLREIAAPRRVPGRGSLQEGAGLNRGPPLPPGVMPVTLPALTCGIPASSMSGLQ